LTSLHQASRNSVEQTKEVAARMKRIADRVVEVAGERALGRAQALALLDGITALGEAKAVSDCTTAEQTVYAVGAINAFLKGSGNAGFDAPYNEAVDSVNCRRSQFDVVVFRASLGKIRDSARKLAGH